MELVPERRETVVLHCSVHLANVSLGEIVQDKNGRSVVKLHYFKSGGGVIDRKEGNGHSSFVLCALTAGKVSHSIIVNFLFPSHYILQSISSL